MSETDQTLAKIGLFAGLTPDEVKKLGGRCTWRLYKADQEVLGHHEQSRAVYFVAQGSVRATVFTASGTEVAFRDIGAGEFFGELSAIDGQTRSAAIVAQSESLVSVVI